MIRQNEDVSGLLYVKVTEIKPIGKEKFGKSKLFIKVGDHMTSLNCDLSDGPAQKVRNFDPKMFHCKPEHTFDLEFSDTKSVNEDAELHFPLKKLTEMPRVKHLVKAKLIKTDRKWNNKAQFEVQNVVEVDLQIIYLNNVQGMLVIETMQVELTRDTQFIGKMDPFLVMNIGKETRRTKAKNNEGKHCVWAQKFQMEIRDAANTKLQIKVFDKDPLNDDLVGEAKIQMLKENLLIPSDKLKEKEFDLYYKGQSAGTVKIQYRFEIVPFNY